jgi:hypothetical protein
MAASAEWQAQQLVAPESEEAARTRAVALLAEAHGAAASDAADAALDADALRACQAGALMRKAGKRGESGAAGASTRALFFQARPGPKALAAHSARWREVHHAVCAGKHAFRARCVRAALTRAR